VKSVNYSLSYSLGKNGRGQDPSAVDYIAAVRATGVAVNSNKAGKINTFYKKAKASGYYPSLKRFYLPIWGSANANAIDLISLGSGTFNGGVTHGAGFVQGDGSTGYFDIGDTPTDLGISETSGFGAVLRYGGAGNTTTLYGSKDLAGTRGFSFNGGGSNRASIGTTSSPFAQLSSTENSILVANRPSISNITCYKYQSGALSTGTANGFTPSALDPYNIYCMAANIANVASEFDDEQIGAWVFGLGLTVQQITDFTLHLKNLWEGTTNLTIS